MPDSDAAEEIIEGINASPGICIGKAYLVGAEGVDVIEKYQIPEDHLEEEIKRFKSAVQRAGDELRSIIAGANGDFEGQMIILKTHEVLLKDKMLYGRTIETIEREKVNAEWALKKVGTAVKSMFQNMSDDYLKERAADIGQVSDRILRNLVGANHVDIGAIDKRVILVANELSPADASQINLERIKGFITDRGGKTSHTSIIARTLGIPAVMGLKNITRRIGNDDVIIVDGIRGQVVINPADQTLLDFEERQFNYERRKAEIARKCHYVAETADGLTVRTMGNIELPEEVVSVKDYGGDGIGLYRTEFQYMNRTDFPGENELFEKYRGVVEAIAPKPVTIRTLDINGDKNVVANGEIEDNPALGMRAIRYCLKRPEIFTTQIRAILRAAAFGKVRILFPMISSYEEILEARQIMTAAADSLAAENLVHSRHIEVGIMIEVPSAVVMADAMAEVVDFFSIGTNDLIQYTLAIDRGNRHVAPLFHPLHPAILRLLKQVTDVAKDKGIPVFMCGEMAADPLSVPILLGLGLDELSMNPQSIPAVKTMIRTVKVDEARAFVKLVLKQKTTADVTRMVEEAYGGLINDQIYCE